MKKLFFLFVIFGFFLHVTPCFSKDECADIDLSQLSKHLPKLPPNTKIISKKGINGLCEIILDINGREIPAYSTKHFVIIGQLFKNKQNLSMDSINGLKKASFSKVKSKIDKGVTFSLLPKDKKTTNTIYFFTDPLCPYCHRAVQQIEDFVEKTKSNVKIILYSVHGNKGNMEIENVICSNMDFETYKNTKFPLKGHKSCTKGENLIKLGQELAYALGINAVPAFVLEDGTQITGANLERLEMAVTKLNISQK